MESAGHLDQAHGHCFVTSGNQLAAWFANLVLSNFNAIASNTLVGIYCKASLADTADFGADVFNTKTLFSLASCNCLAFVQSREQFVSFCFRIESHVKFTFHVKILFAYSMSLLYRHYNTNTTTFGTAFAKIFCFGNISKTCKRLAELWRYICVARKVLVYQFLIKEITMKQLIALIATTVFAVSVFAQAPAAKKEEKKADAKPAAAAPAPAATTAP